MFADNRLTAEDRRTDTFCIGVTSWKMNTTDVTVGRQRRVSLGILASHCFLNKPGVPCFLVGCEMRLTCKKVRCCRSQPYPTWIHIIVA